MKFIEFSSIVIQHDDDYDAIGIQWSFGLERPPTMFLSEHQNYWSSFRLYFVLVRKRWILEFRLRKQPYRSKAQYIAWLRAQEKGLTLSREELEKADELAKLNPDISDKIAARIERDRRTKVPPE